MASKKRSAIDQTFEFLLPPLPDAIKDIIHNDHYKPNNDIVDNWTVFVKNDENDIFVLRFAYQIKTDIEETEKWVKIKSWTVECAVAQGDYVVIDLGKKTESPLYCTSLTIHSTRMSVKMAVQMRVASISRRNSKTMHAMHLGRVSGLDVS
jgi:hypothetical protein